MAGTALQPGIGGRRRRNPGRPPTPCPISSSSELEMGIEGGARPISTAALSRCSWGWGGGGIGLRSSTGLQMMLPGKLANPSPIPATLPIYDARCSSAGNTICRAAMLASRQRLAVSPIPASRRRCSSQLLACPGWVDSRFYWRRGRAAIDGGLADPSLSSDR